MSSVYQYAPLSGLPDDTIRLLELCPGHSSQKIKCELSTAQLTLRPKFAALSYVWGSEPASEEIELNSHRFWIRKNLWQCLMRLRETTRPLKIWIDAICVNQQDIRERNQQVKFMNHIFSTAKPVFAWIGENVGEVSASLQEDLLDLRKFVAEYRESGLRTIHANVTEKVVRVCDSLASLCTSQYWRRMWIVQEILVAQKLFLCFQGQRVAWEDVRWCRKTLPWNVKLGDTLCNEPRAVEAVKHCNTALIGGCLIKFLLWSRNETVGGSSSSTPHSLSELISTYGEHECSDLRDRVYALLGLRKYRYVHRLRDRPQLQADYGKTAADLFFDVILFEGIPVPSFPGKLCHLLDLKLKDLEPISRSRMRDTFQYNMKLEAKVQGVLFNKLEGLTHSDSPCHSQIVLIEPEDQSPMVSGRSEREDPHLPDYLLAFAVGNRAVRTVDFVFRLQHSSILIVFRYERSYFQPIARVQQLALEHNSIVYEKEKAALWFREGPSMLLQKVYAPMIDFEIWNGLQELNFGPDVLLKILRHDLYHPNAECDDWSSLKSDREAQGI